MTDSSMKTALVPLRVFLKANGFSVKGTMFHRVLEGGNTAMLAIQKSVKSSSSETLFTLNYGIYSACIGRSLHAASAESRDLSAAHWRKRLGDGVREEWVKLSGAESAAEASSALLACAKRVLPDLLEHSTDTALRDEWLRGHAPGLGKMQRLLFLAILLHEIGPRERLEGVLRELRELVSGGIHQGLIEMQLAEAGVLKKP